MRFFIYTPLSKGQNACSVPETGPSGGRETVQTNMLESKWKKEAKSGEKEQEVESCLSVSDLLSLAGFRTKFTSFHDIAKAQLSVGLPGQNTQGLDRYMGLCCEITKPCLWYMVDQDNMQGKWKGAASFCLYTIGTEGGVMVWSSFCICSRTKHNNSPHIHFTQNTCAHTSVQLTLQA